MKTSTTLAKNKINQSFVNVDTAENKQQNTTEFKLDTTHVEKNQNNYYTKKKLLYKILHTQCITQMKTATCLK